MHANHSEILKNAYRLAAKESDDPLTKNAAILINRENIVIGQGANRFPNQVKNLPHRLGRPDKYDYIIHAEQNAIAQAAKQGHATDQSTLYCPWAACTFCARLIIQSGIKKVITHRVLMEKSHMKWPQEIGRAKEMFNEAEVEYVEFEGFIGGVTHLFNGSLWNP